MNSFFQRKDHSTIEIQNKYPNTSIWNLGSFDNVLDEHYTMPEPPDDEDILTLNNPRRWLIPIRKLSKWEKIESNNGYPILKQQVNKEPPEPPDFNKLFNNNINLLSDDIKEKIEFSSYKNVAICNFLKTFNIMQWTESSPIEFQNDWNVFNVLQYLHNSDTDDLEYFTNEFMPYITQISGLKWWINNMSQNKRSKIFDEDFKDNKDIAYLKEKMEDFNPNLDKKNTLKFADLIKEKILNNTTAESERKIDKNKMIQFKTDLDNWMDPDRQLANALENV